MQGKNDAKTLEKLESELKKKKAAATKEFFLEMHAAGMLAGDARLPHGLVVERMKALLNIARGEAEYPREVVAALCEKLPRRLGNGMETNFGWGDEAYEGLYALRKRLAKDSPAPFDTDFPVKEIVGFFVRTLFDMATDFTTVGEKPSTNSVLTHKLTWILADVGEAAVSRFSPELDERDAEWVRVVSEACGETATPDDAETVLAMLRYFLSHEDEAAEWAVATGMLFVAARTNENVRRTLLDGGIFKILDESLLKKNARKSRGPVAVSLFALDKENGAVFGESPLARSDAWFISAVEHRRLGSLLECGAFSSSGILDSFEDAGLKNAVSLRTRGEWEHMESESETLFSALRKEIETADSGDIEKTLCVHSELFNKGVFAEYAEHAQEAYEAYSVVAAAAAASLERPEYDAGWEPSL